MPWKQDLAKLKQQLGSETPVPAPKIPTKPAPNTGPKPALDEEDAVFLSAMGLRPSTPNPVRTVVGAGSPPAQVIADPPTPETFQEAVKDLKGLKPLAKGHQGRPTPTPGASPAALEPPRPALVPVAPPASATTPPIPLAPEAGPLSRAARPLRFQLAAGMAIEVDGALDLRSHSLADAMERLKDRLGDGVVLGWRSLLVTLGPNPALHDGLLTLLAAGETPMVARYAQAPVPMGGNQAWLLYLVSPPAQNA